MPKFAPPQSDKLTDRGTLDFTIAVLSHYFDLSADGYVCQTPDLWRVLVTAAAQSTYIETVCHDLPDAPDSNTVRGYLKDQLTPERIRALPRDCNRALASQLPTWLRDHPKDVAIDLHDEPYYGKDDDPDDPACWVCRGEARDGTTRFYRCATAYVMQRDVRFTLAVEFVHPDDDLGQTEGPSADPPRKSLENPGGALLSRQGLLRHSHPALATHPARPSGDHRRDHPRQNRRNARPCVRAAGAISPTTPFAATRMAN